MLAKNQNLANFGKTKTAFPGLPDQPDPADCVPVVKPVPGFTPIDRLEKFFLFVVAERIWSETGLLCEFADGKHETIPFPEGGRGVSQELPTASKNRCSLKGFSNAGGFQSWFVDPSRGAAGCQRSIDSDGRQGTDADLPGTFPRFVVLHAMDGHGTRRAGHLADKVDGLFAQRAASAENFDGSFGRHFFLLAVEKLSFY